MEQPSFEKKTILGGLIFEYEAVSQVGDVPFFEKAAFWDIANWYSKNGMPDQSLLAVENALRHHYHTVELHIFRLELLIQIGTKTAIMKAFSEVQDLTAGQDQLVLFRAEAYYYRNEPEKTLLLLLSLKPAMEREKELSIPTSRLQCFERLQMYGNIYDALAEAVIRQPDNELLLEEVWMCVEVNENYRDSIALHKTVLDRSPYSHFAWHNLGFALRSLGKWEEALDAFEYSYIIDRYFEQGYREYGALAFEKGRYRAALLCYQELMAQLGEDESIIVRIGACYQKLGDIKIARAMYEKALQLDHANAEAHYRIGECFSLQGDYHNALKWLRQAVSANARRDEFHALLGDVFENLGKMKEAEEHYWTAIELAPDEQRYWIKMSSFFIGQGNPAEALEVLDSAMENIIERNEALYYRTACLFMLGNRTKAMRQLRRALVLDHGAHKILFELVPSLSEDLTVCRAIEKMKV